jgi:hypothetical protein
MRHKTRLLVNGREHAFIKVIGYHIDRRVSTLRLKEYLDESIGKSDRGNLEISSMHCNTTTGEIVFRNG